MISRSLSNKISSEKFLDVRKTLRLIGCRDDTYLWSNLIYYSFMSVALLMICFFVFYIQYLIFGSAGSPNYTSSSLFHCLGFHIIYFPCSLLFAMILA